MVTTTGTTRNLNLKNTKMKKLIILILLLPTLSYSQTISLKDTTMNLLVSISNYGGYFMSDYNKNIEFKSFSNTNNLVSIDTLDHSVTVERYSKKNNDYIKWDLYITDINRLDGYGCTYNLIDYYSGTKGFLSIQESGIVIFVNESNVENGVYVGFMGFLN
jgi:hypothetical protein|tara:strand:- start:49 stop:531 length:483 start_codon:yes stop_codon:yes gene_type:complete